MRPLQLAAIGAFGIGRRAQRVMRPPHVAARGRGFLFRNSHDCLVASCALRIAPPQAGTERRARGVAVLSQIPRLRQQRWRAPGKSRQCRCAQSGTEAVSRSRRRSRSTSRISPANGLEAVAAADSASVSVSTPDLGAARERRQRQREFLRDRFADIDLIADERLERYVLADQAGSGLFGLRRAVEQLEPLGEYPGDRIERNDAPLLESGFEIGAQQNGPFASGGSIRPRPRAGPAIPDRNAGPARRARHRSR